MNSALLSLPGAVAADGPDTGIAAHYGDPLAEQRALYERVGWIDRSNRGVISVSGPDRLSWLHSITSQHLSQLGELRSAEALVLSPHGHVEHHFVVSEVGDVTWLDIEPGAMENLLSYLDSMRFLLRVTDTDVTEQWAMLSIVGPETEALLLKIGAVLPAEPYDVESLAGGGWVRRMPWPDHVAADLLVPRELLPQAAQRLTDAGARPAGIWAFEALRVADRRPRVGWETDHRTIPHEIGFINVAVHLDKGCYRGQETVARVQNLGRPPRRLVLGHLDGSVESLPAPGTPVLLADRTVGFIGTPVRHYELGPIALAVVKRSISNDAALFADGIPILID